jgi:hypothetical protein
MYWSVYAMATAAMNVSAVSAGSRAVMENRPRAGPAESAPPPGVAIPQRAEVPMDRVEPSMGISRSASRVDEELRARLLVMASADGAAVTAFLAEADNHRTDLRAPRAIESQLPWPWLLLEWPSDEDPPPSVTQVIATTTENTRQLRQIVRRHGWPGRRLVGEDGADAAWLVLQHACSQVTTVGTAESLAFVRQCLPLLRRAVDVAEAHPRHLAAASDGLRRALGEPPEYGVLGLDITVADGVPQVRATADIDAMDRRRAAIGLPPLADDIRRRAMGDPLSPAGAQRAEPWPPR